MEFGEVVTPSSRAFWNDYEDLDNRTADPTPVAVFDTVAETVSRDKLRSVQKLVVLEGRQGIFDFAAATIARGPAQEKCLLRIGNGCVVYLVDDAEDTALVLSEIPDVMQYGPVTEQLVQLLNEREVPWVITISVEPAVAYKSAAINETDVVNPCFLRSIASACGTTNAVKALTEPNLITGIAASLATWCKIQGRPFSSYVAYTNEPQLNSLTTAPILRLLRQLGVPCADAYIMHAVKDSNLYT